MFGSYTDLPWLRHYACALEHHDSTKPIRGTNIRPLINTFNGKRRKHMQILKHSDGSVACRLYATDVLTYLPNGEIHFTNGGSASNTTHQFATALLYSMPGPCSFGSYKGQTTATTRKKTVIIEDGEVLKLKHDKDTGFDFIDPPKMYAYYLKRAPMGMRRKEIEPFTKYVLALAKMVDPEQYKEEKLFVNPHVLYRKVTGDEKDWAEAAEFLLSRCCVSRGPWNNRCMSIIPKDITNMLDDMLKYLHSDELFEQREVDKPSTNNNERYMTGGAFLL